MQQNSRILSKIWSFPRHKPYEKKLRISASKWFKGKNYSVNPRYPYILEHWEDWQKNIILEEVVKYIKKIRYDREREGKGFPLHKYIHHGLSSQALLFNLIGPLITRNDLEPLKNVIQNKNIIWPDVKSVAEFEYEDRKIFNEDSGQPTSIDLVVKNSKDFPTLFVESKLVEKEFAGCSVYKDGDCDGQNPSNDFSQCYLHHIGRKYWELFYKYGFLQTQISTDSLCVLVNNYQYFREILFSLEHNGTFILLSDERNPTFYSISNSKKRGLMNYLEQFIPVNIKNRIGNITVQELVSEIEKTSRHEWLCDFKKKYDLN